MPTRLHLEHTMPGRARLRVPKPRTAGEVDRVAEHIRSLKRVQSVEASPATGSIYIHFDSADPVGQLMAEIAGLGYLLEEVFAGAGRTTPVPMSRGAAEVQEVLTKVNATVHAATAGRADLRLLVPAGLLALAGRQMIRDFRSLTNAPWYTLLYYAFDSFHKMHITVERELPGGVPSARRGGRRPS